MPSAFRRRRLGSLGRNRERRLFLAAALSIAVAGAACQRSRRELHEKVPFTAPPRSIGAGLQENPYENNAYAMTEGQRLYDWYNCSGCHSRGGGGIGPALMDEVWIYGKEPANLFATIVDGRPNGMPAWRGKIPEYQIWQIVTYVQTLRGDRSISAPPGPREEHLQAGEGLSSR